MAGQQEASVASHVYRQQGPASPEPTTQEPYTMPSKSAVIFPLFNFVEWITEWSAMKRLRPNGKTLKFTNKKTEL